MAGLNGKCVTPSPSAARSLLAVMLVSVGVAHAAAGDPESPAKSFLELYNSLYQGQTAISAEAFWKAATDVSEVHEANRILADQAYAAVVGNAAVVSTTQSLLAAPERLDPLEKRQLQAILLRAADYPGTIPEVVQARIQAEARQSAVLDGYRFCLVPRAADRSCPEPKTANDIDALLLDSRDLVERQKVWEASKEIGRELKPGLVTLQRLRNQVAREMGYSSFFAMQVANYDISVDDMMSLLDGFARDIDPLYRELGTWANRRYAQRYGAALPAGDVPAHWYTNRWAQEWGGMVDGVDLDPYFSTYTPEKIVAQSEEFYVSLGFEALPKSFWERSDLYPVPKGDTRRKNAHASAWHMDLGQDIRSLMSVEANANWFFTSHHELGHIYYYRAYTRAEVPPVLREGANRAFHEAMGELASLAAGQVPYLKAVGVLPPKAKIDPILAMLREALEMTVAFVPWSAGVMSRFEYELYEKNLPPEQWQQRWWELVSSYQHVAPPDVARLVDPALCDACTKTHINDDPGSYYDYAIATVIKYQLHEHIAKKILKQDPRSCNYYGNKEVGAFLQQIMAEGATRPWRDVLRDATGEELSTRAMIEYYAPLHKWLEKENRKASR